MHPPTYTIDKAPTRAAWRGRTDMPYMAWPFVVRAYSATADHRIARAFPDVGAVRRYVRHLRAAGFRRARA